MYLGEQIPFKVDYEPKTIMLMKPITSTKRNFKWNRENPSETEGEGKIEMQVVAAAPKFFQE